SHLDRETGFRSDADNALQKISRVGIGVGMRKPIAQIDPNVPVVGMPHDRLAVTPLHATNCARFYLECHVVTSRHYFSGRGNTAAPRGMIKPSPAPACSRACSIERTGTI